RRCRAAALAAGAQAERDGPRQGDHHRTRSEPPARAHCRAGAGGSADRHVHRAGRTDDLPRLPRRHARLPVRRHPRPPVRLPGRGAHRVRRAVRGVLRDEEHLLRPGRGVHHHRAGRRPHVPRRHPQKGAVVITLTDVVKNYTREVRIGPVYLQIPAGGVTDLIGPNGAGKSTLLTMIGRLLGLDSGTIEIAGLDVATTRSRDLARVVSVLRQENHFITRLTVRQLVSFGRFPYSQGRLTAEDEEMISNAIDFFELADLEGRYLDELSGGQRQRAYVAMVLCQDTEFVLLDEPLNNLDMRHSVLMMKRLR